MAILVAAVAADDGSDLRRTSARARPAGALLPPSAPLPESRALGLPYKKGRLRGGVQLAAEGPTFFTWDGVKNRKPNPGWRRWGTHLLVGKLTRVLEVYARKHPGAPRLGVADLSRRRGGSFGRRHRSHQNGLDVDVYYPRKDRRERAPRSPGDVDRRLSQSLVREFLRAGAEYVFVGLRVRLKGPKGVVMPIPNHDDHMHVRFRNPHRAG